jgi:hypothetical protein
MAAEPNKEPIFVECCTWASPATILLSDDGQELQARFVRYLHESSLLVFAVQNTGGSPNVDDVRLGQPCAVTFGYQGRPRLFISVIKECYRDADRTLVELAARRKIATAEVRGAVRVPVLDDLLFVKMVIEGDEVHHPRARNLSFTGMLIAFDNAADPKLYPLDKVGLELRLGEEQVALRGVVRRCEPLTGETRYGLLFPETIAGEIPPTLRRMVDQIERRWLEANRSKQTE